MSRCCATRPMALSQPPALINSLVLNMPMVFLLKAVGGNVLDSRETTTTNKIINLSVMRWTKDKCIGRAWGRGRTSRIGNYSVSLDVLLWWGSSDLTNSKSSGNRLEIENVIKPSLSRFTFLIFSAARYAVSSFWFLHKTLAIFYRKLSNTSFPFHLNMTKVYWGIIILFRTRSYEYGTI